MNHSCTVLPLKNTTHGNGNKHRPTYPMVGDKPFLTVLVLQTVCLSSTRFIAHLVNQQVVSSRLLAVILIEKCFYSLLYNVMAST